MPLITLTRNQFLQKRPKGDYQSYLRYLGTQRAGIPHGTPTGKLVDLPMNPAAVNKVLLQNVMSGALNPKQMRQQAVQAVNDSIRTALGDLRGTTAAAQKQATDQARAYEGFAKYLADARAADAGQIQSLYSGAAQQQAQFAQGLTGQVGAAAQASDQANLRDIAAASGGGAGYHAPDPGQMANIANYVGGYLPSANLAENAAYAGADVRSQALSDAVRLALGSGEMRAKTLDLQAELARGRRKLIEGRPAAIREQLKGLSDDQRANLATLANVLYLQNTQAKTTAEQLGTYQGQPTINTYRDASGRLRTYDPNKYSVATSKNGTQFLKPLPAPPGSSSTTKNAAGFTPAQQATQDRALNKALQGGRSNMLSMAQDQKGPLWTPGNPLLKGLPGGAPTRKSYAQAKTYLMTNFANDLIKQYPDQKKRILQMVEEALSSAGFVGSAARAPGQPPKSIVIKPALPTIKVPGGGFALPKR